MKRVYGPRPKSKTPKRQKYSTIVNVPKKNLLGSSQRVVHKYVEYGQLNGGAAGAPATVVFSANGMYDVNVSGGGHQPRGFDQMTPLFDHYRVRASTIKLTIGNGSSNYVTSAVCGILLIDDATPPADCIQDLENRDTSYAMYSVGGNAVTVKNSFLTSRFFSKARSGDSLIGNASANPSDQAYYVCFVQDPNGGDLWQNSYIAEITYEVDWIEPNNVASS